jgi:uncharacterized membrane protein YhiD involved in acid resistance
VGSIFASTGDQWAVLPPVLLGLLLTALIGVEREVRAKSAGCARTPWSASGPR